MKELTSIKGLGVKAKELLNKLGVMNVDDLLTNYPVRYDILKRSDLSNVTEEDKIIVDAIVKNSKSIDRNAVFSYIMKEMKN